MSCKFLFIILFFFVSQLSGQDVSEYNIVWNSHSKNAGESMPCGGGDIGMNIWVEKGDILIYIARSGSFNEDNALMKAGRIRLRLFPNPFFGEIFKQELHLKDGYVTLQGKSGNQHTSVKIWADVFSPIAHIEINGSKKMNVEASYESWRFEDRILNPRENFGNSWKWAAPKNHTYKRDIIDFDANDILFYHQNKEETIFDVIVAQQGMDSVKNRLFNPLKGLVFGGCFSGKNFIPAGTSLGEYQGTEFRSWKIKNKYASNNHSLSLTLHNAQLGQVELWKKALDSISNCPAAAGRYSFQKSQEWWHQFWRRSFINIDQSNQGSADWEVGRNYQLFRYMLACNARGIWPTKFNGGLFTVDPVFTDSSKKLTPDFRNWGGGLHTAQNQRLVYFPMIKNGDWDMLQPQFDFYFRILNNALLRTNVYWNHGGACFTEQMENFGLPNFAEYGQKRPAGFDKGLEFNAWLEYEWDTVFEFCLMMLEEERYTGKDISDRIFFIESCLQFFDEHYQWLAKQRGVKPLDGNGKLILYPGSGGETYKMAYNSTSTIVALQTITKRLLELPSQFLSAEKRLKWQGFLSRIPSYVYNNHNGKITIAPAKNWERINNVESPQLYPVYPWGIFGIGKPGLDTAINTWLYDSSVVKFRSHIGWKQDNIWAADLGLTEEAWRLTSLKLENAPRRFPAFWGPGFDWVPDHNWGGSGMIGLQEMLMQTDGKKIYLFPSWPKNKDVHFKLHAPYLTCVEAELENGKMIMLKVIPETRKQDIIMMLK